MELPSNKQRSYLESALRKAEKHDSGGRVKVWAIAEQNSSIIAEDGNDYVDRSAINKLGIENVMSLHAELAVIAKLAKKEKVPKGMTLYIAGFGRHLSLANTRPCPICSKAIKKSGVFDKIVYYENGEPRVIRVDEL